MHEHFATPVNTFWRVKSIVVTVWELFFATVSQISSYFPGSSCSWALQDTISTMKRLKAKELRKFLFVVSLQKIIWLAVITAASVNAVWSVSHTAEDVLSCDDWCAVQLITSKRPLLKRKYVLWPLFPPLCWINEQSEEDQKIKASN